MASKFADKSGPLPPSAAGFRENYRFPGVLFGSRRNRGRQVAYSHQIVGGGGKGEHPAHPFYTSVTSFPEIAHGFHPAEDFLHPFAQALTEDIARMASGTPVNGRSPALAVLGHVGHSIQGAQREDKFPNIISFITAHGNAMPAGKVAHQALCRVPLGGAGCLGEARQILPLIGYE